MLQVKQNITGPWSEIPHSNRLLVTRKRCAVCGAIYGKLRAHNGKVYLAKEAIDHLLARRFLEARGIDPHRIGNLLSTCIHCHGLKVGFEERLFAGDVLGFLQGIKCAGYPVDKVVRFAVSVGLVEFSGFHL